ncbi:MAG TPA: GNAT family N-acetyltransferase [Luteimonas sp.]|nr:GNAT family N-acetyltransferase [Luteimonas sp.]
MSPAFPAPRRDHLQAPPGLVERGIALRWLGADDEQWLRALYADTRAQELALVAWPDAARQAFVAQQFMLQHRHFVSACGAADFLAVCSGATPLGRLYLERAAPVHRLLDITLFAQARGRGIGSALIAAAQRDAAACGASLRLHVLLHNPDARRLYARLGFEPAGEAAPYLWMEWREPACAGVAGLS